VSVTVVPNSGILQDDYLDRLRGDALTASDAGLPEPLVYYLRALEKSFMTLKARERERWRNEIDWKHAPVAAEGQG
jgi:hypothetical protein